MAIGKTNSEVLLKSNWDDELTLNSIQVAAIKITFVVCLHISETMPCV